MTEEEKKQAHKEQVTKMGQANKGRKRPDIAETDRIRGEKRQKVREQTERKKIFNGQKPAYTNPILLAYRLAKFMVNCDNTEWENSSGKKMGKPYTIAGGKAASGMLSCWQNYMNGDSDHFVDNQDVIVSREGVQSTTLNDVEDEYLPYTLYLLGDPDGYLADTAIDRNEYTERYKGEYFSDILKRFALTVEAQREEDLYLKGRTSDIFIHRSRYGWQDDTVIVNRREMISSQEAREKLEEILKLPTID